MNFKVHSSSAEETFQTGARLGRQLRGREVVLISGGLGCGKTVLAKGVASGLGIDPHDIVSPSFVLMNCYGGKHRLFHVDLYRLGPIQASFDWEIDDYLGQGVVVIEWAQYLPPGFFTGDDVVEVNIETGTDSGRDIIFQSTLEYVGEQ